MTHTTGQANSRADDADPMIDALLAEFVPTDPAKRKVPPDLSGRILAEMRRLDAAEESHIAMASDADAEIDDADPMLDVLLAEFVPANPADRKSPPDLSDRILSELHRLESEPTPPPKVSVASEPVAVTPAPDSARPVVRRILRFAVIASVLGIGWFAWPRTDVRPGGEIAAVEQQDAVPEPEAVVTSPVTEEENEERPPSRPRELSPPENDSLASESRSSTAPQPPIGPAEVSKPVSLAAMAKSVADLSEDYWKSLGITPTPEAANHEVVSRLKGRLGVALSADSLRDVNRLRRQIARGSDEITARWLAGASARSLRSVEESKALVDTLSTGFDGQASFDETLVSLINGENEHSSDWYQMLGGSNSEIVAVRLADLSMDADLRCVRCHDSMIGGDLTQDNYWSFVALLRSTLKRNEDRWIVDSAKPASPVFFDLPDGRARMAEPRVDFLSETKPTEWTEWTSTLTGSKELADGLVDSLWKLVYGRGLSASAFDADAAPIDQSLRALHAQLSEDLRASDFDMARTLALIVSSPMARRSVPESLRQENALTASSQSRERALELVGAFAAATEAPRSTRVDRVELAMRRIGKRFGTLESDLLAQPIPSSSGQGSLSPKDPRESFRDLLSIDFPRDDAPLPVSWLRSIEDYDEQVRHLVYLSGRGSGGKLIETAAEQLGDAGSRESALSRVWWILSE
ncbi:MAG: hypothetical protein AAFX06_25770 [Planctomycetota bacterium]